MTAPPKSARLVIQTSFLGDMVLTTPLIERLAARGPVDVLTTPAAAALLANHPAVRDTIIFDKKRRDAGVGGFVRTARTLRGRAYGAALLAQGSTRSGALALAAGIPVRVGFDSSAGRRFYTRRVPYVDNVHHVERLLALADPDIVSQSTSSVPRPSLFPGDDERAMVDALLAGRSEAPLVALAPGSVWATKRWPGYAELAALLARDVGVVVLGSAADAALATEIARANPRTIDATGRVSLLGAAELLRRCGVLVTNDSAPQHLASAMNTPTVAIFGPTVPGFGFGPLSAKSVVLGLDSLPCRPCDRHGPNQCPLRHWRCMRDVPAAQVAAAVRGLLSH